MFRRVAIAAVAMIVTAATVSAQEISAGAGRFEIGAFPGGGMFFTKSSSGNAPDFGNFAINGSFTYNVNRWIGLEAEGGGSIGVRQNFTVSDQSFTDTRTPNMWAYSGNLVYSPAASDRSLVPYVTAGAGGLTMCPCGDAKSTLGITTYQTYLTGNAGAGLKWFSSHHVGLRLDYRLFAVKGKDIAPAFFGTDTRYGHRVQGGVVLTY